MENYNSLKESADDFPVQVRNDGSVYWAFDGRISTLCEIKILKFPFDTQTCGVTLGIWGHTKHRVRLIRSSPEPVVVYPSIENNQLWKLVGKYINST